MLFSPYRGVAHELSDGWPIAMLIALVQRELLLPCEGCRSDCFGLQSALIVRGLSRGQFNDQGRLHVGIWLQLVASP